ncbi:MAG: 2'-5' RNA ligase family protein [Agathobacter sp.]|nr:2'-5' RNA ligase family protein [Agathobacter sp.]
MYLISVYFDDKTQNRIQSYINDVASACGNSFMIDNNVPPHITISAFETLNEDYMVEVLDSTLSNIKSNMISWVTVGSFPTVIFIQPVLNEYLHNLSSTIYESIKKIPDTKVSKYYKPFHWLSHATIAKQLSEEEMRVAFCVLQKSFGMFEGEIVRIELAKKNPYRLIKCWELKDE